MIKLYNAKVLAFDVKFKYMGNAIIKPIKIPLHFIGESHGIFIKD
jgi:hypothetical protein